MKKLFSISLLFSVTAMMFTGCVSEEDDLFDTSAAERLMQSKKTYTERLGGSTWAMEFYPLNTDEAPKGSGYLILNQFKKDGSVIQAMQNDLTDGQYLTDTSLWEVISDQGTVLTFNTFNKCIHTFSDPGLYQTGQGYEGDYEFVILSLEENAKYGMLKGKKRGTYNRLTRLPDDTNFEEYLQDIVNFQNKVFPSSAPNDCMMNIGDSTIVFTEGNSGIASLYPFGGDAISETTDHAFLITKSDGKYYLRFREELPGKDDDKVQEFVYDEAADVFKAVDNENNLIQGPSAGWFYGDALRNGHKWLLARSAEMSDAMKQIYENMYNGFRKFGTGKYTLQNVQFSLVNDDTADSGKLKLDIAYRVSNSSAHLLVYYDVVFTDEGVTISNRQPQGNGQTVIDGITGIKEFLAAVEGAFTASPDGSAFNMSTLKLTSATDGNISFVLTFIN